MMLAFCGLALATAKKERGGARGGGALPLGGLAALEGRVEALVRPSTALLSCWRVLLMLASSEAWPC
jgi:hypothetical protein